MSTVPPTTLSWLYRVLTNTQYGPNQTYRDPPQTYNDVATLLAQHPTFAPRTDVYTYENGASALLLLLAGTLPVSFRGVVYRFPVTIWVPLAYPWTPPIVYVTPTAEMVVRPGQHVTADGRVYHHYLARWGNAPDRSTLSDFLSVLRDVFAKEPPVVAKPPRHAAPVPPPPPPPPPKPGRENTPQETPERKPPPLPPLPTELRQQPPWQLPSQQNPPQQSPSQQMQVPPPRAIPQRAYSIQPFSPVSPQQYPYHQPMQELPVTASTPITHGAPLLPKPAPAQDFLTSPFDLPLPASTPQPAPPIPPNPEKDALLNALSHTLTTTLHADLAKARSGLDSLASQAAAMRAAAYTLNHELADTTALHATLVSNISILTQSLHHGDAVIADARARLQPTDGPNATATATATATGLPAVDELLVAPTVVGKQVYDLVCAERGIQRALYALQAGLVRGRVSTEVWMRMTRGLAREAFGKKALAVKAARGMGLGVGEV